MSLWAVTAACIALVTGCWGQVEVGDMSIVMALGIDRTQQGMVRVTAQVINPATMQAGAGQGGGGTGKGYKDHTSTGKTFDEAMHNFLLSPWRPLYFAHNTMVVFGAAYAQQGISQALDYFDRNREFRRIQMFAVSKGLAQDELATTSGIERVNARALRELVEHQNDAGWTLPSIQLNVTDQLLAASHTPLVSSLSLDSRGTPTVSGIAVFQGDKLADFVDVPESRGILWFLSQVHRAQLLIPCPKHATGSHTMGSPTPGSPKTLAIQILNSQAEIEPVISGNLPAFHVKVRGVGEVSRLCEEAPTKRNMQDWSQVTSSVVQQEMEAALAKVQSDGVDAVQFGTALFRSNPSYWRAIAKQWPAMFPRVKVTYDVEFHLIRTGMSSKNPEHEYTPEIYPPASGRGAIPS